MQQNTIQPKPIYWQRFKKLNQEMALSDFLQLVNVTRQDLSQILQVNCRTVDRYLHKPEKLNQQHRQKLYQFYRCCVYHR